MNEAISNFFGFIMRWAYNLFSSAGSEPELFSYFAMCLLFMALINKLISIPLMAKQTNSAKKIQDLQPQLQELEKKYGYDERILQQKQMEFYQEHNMGMGGCTSCLPMIIQIILLFAIFAVIRDPAKHMFDSMEQFEAIRKNFLWIPDLTKPDPLKFVGLPLISAALQFLSSRMMAKTNPQMGQMKAMSLIMPLIIYFMSIRWPAALVLYWTFNYIIDIIWRLISRFVIKKDKQPEEVEA